MRDREANLDLREAVAGLRFLIVGGKRPEWWEPLRSELGLSPRTEWIESEKEKMPPMDDLTARIKKGTPSGVIVVVRIGHAISSPLKALTKDLGITFITVKYSRDDMLAALREHYVSPAQRHPSPPKR